MRAKGARGGVAPPRDTAEEEYCCFVSDDDAVDRRRDEARDLAATRASAADVIRLFIGCYLQQ